MLGMTDGANLSPSRAVPRGICAHVLGLQDEPLLLACLMRNWKTQEESPVAECRNVCLT